MGREGIQDTADETGEEPDLCILEAVLFCVIVRAFLYLVKGKLGGKLAISHMRTLL